jgi:hypothetical protein
MPPQFSRRSPNRSAGRGSRFAAAPEGILVDRKGDPAAWLWDLWLAERLADAL